MMKRASETELEELAPLVVYEIEMASGFRCKFLNLGASILEIIAPDREGKLENIVLAYPEMETYRVNPSYLGATVGPTSGRVWHGNLGQGPALTLNKGEHQIHGGPSGLSFTAFEGSLFEKEHCKGIVFTARHEDGKDGYPGNKDIQVIYTLYEDFQLEITYRVISDEDTWVNLTNHTYFNLSGDKKSSILDHELLVAADQVLVLDETSVPTGELMDTKGTCFDFHELRAVGLHLRGDEPILMDTKGYDHPFLLNSRKGEPAVILRDPESGRTVKVETDQPATVIYTMNYETPPFGTRGGICIECQNPPIGKNSCFEGWSRLKAGVGYIRKIKFSMFGYK